MTFARPEHWLWDFWLADDGKSFHMFYLHAPKSLGNPDLRHRNARIGHATSSISSTGPITARSSSRVHPAASTTPPIGRAASRAATMAAGISTTPARTGSRPTTTTTSRPSGLLCPTISSPGPSSRDPSAAPTTAGTRPMAPRPGPKRHGATPGSSPTPTARTWHMLVTARANHGDDMQRGVVGHAVSRNMDRLGRPAAVERTRRRLRASRGVRDILDRQEELRSIFLRYAAACRQAGRRRWAASGTCRSTASPGQMDPRRSQLLATQRLYAGRVVQQRDGQWALMGFDNGPPFLGTISDPIPITAHPDGTLSITGERRHDRRFRDGGRAGLRAGGRSVRARFEGRPNMGAALAIRP